MVVFGYLLIVWCKCVDCCDGSDEYEKWVNCVNVCGGGIIELSGNLEVGLV